MAEKKVVLSVDVKMSDAIKNLAEYKAKIDEIDASIKDLQKTSKTHETEVGKLSQQIKTEGDASGELAAKLKEEKAALAETNREIVRLREEKKAYNKIAAEESNAVQNNLIATNDAYKDSLKALRAELAAGKAELAKMTMGTEEYARKEKEVKTLNDRVKEAEQSYGVFSRSVGDYENAMRAALVPTNSMIGALANAEQTGIGVTGMFKGMVTALKNVGKQALALLANPLFALLAVLALIITGIINAIKSSEEQMSRVNALLAPFHRALDALLNLLQQVAGALLSVFEAYMQGINWVLTQLEKLPGIGKYIAQINEANRDAIQLEKDKYELAKRSRKVEEDAAANELKIDKLRNEAKQKENFTTEERLAKLQEVLDLERADAQERTAIERERLRIMEEEASRAQNNAATEDALSKQRIAVYRAQAEESKRTRRVIGEMNSLRNEIRAEQEAAENAYYSRLQKRVEAHHNFEKRQLELSSIYLYDYAKTAEENAEARFVAEQKYALESFALEQKQAREKLKAQKMTAAERLEAEANLRKQQEQEQAIFTARQLEAMRAHQRELLQAAVDLAGGKDLDGRIEDVRAKYAAAAKSIREDTTMEADERAFYERRLAQREAEEIKQLRLSADEETNKRILEQTEELYRNDVRQVSASNAERIQLEIDKQKRIIAARKAAGLDTLAEERQLVAKEAELRAAALDSSLRLAWNNADEQYRIKREYIERELDAEELSAERRAELEEELTSLTVENNQRKVASIEQWAGAAMDMASGVNDLMNTLGDREVQKAEEKNDREKKALDKRLKAGVISQKDYDKQVAALDADLDAKKKKIAVEQAKREKALKAMQVAVDTAVAIMQLWVNPGFPAAIPMAAVVGALGAVQLATVLATPIPVARRGGRIEGATHEQGGVLVNTENEERIISSAPAKAFPELLNLISYIGKHGGGVPETGYAARMAAAARPDATRGGTSEIDYDLLADKVGARVGERVGEEIRGLRVYLSLTELKEAEREYARIEESAKL